jgi:predicted ribosome quality control (RQC) complex YloA/Tae2 family protein
MAFDGTTIAGVIWEIKNKLLGGRIDKIYMPEADEITLAVRAAGGNHKLLLSANASHPRFHLTGAPQNNPDQPPLFCMVLRKHLSGGRLMDIQQPSFERIVCFHIEALNELGDLVTKKLIAEIMGKYSNIILTDANDIIIDSIKRVTHEKSSVREVLPGRTYVFPPSGGRRSPLELSRDEYAEVLEQARNKKIQSVLYQSFNGVSPVMADELCHRAGVESLVTPEHLDTQQRGRVFAELEKLVSAIKTGCFSPEIILDEFDKPLEFAAMEMSIFSGHKKIQYESVSELLEFFYGERDASYRVKQKTADLKKIITLNIERCVKKAEMYNATLAEIAERDTLRVYGELITANIYAIKKGMTRLDAANYYAEDAPVLSIPLDPNLTPAENAQKYFKQYNKQKRTFAAVAVQMEQNEAERLYLDSLLATLDTVVDERDIADIRDELAVGGFVKKRRATAAEARQAKQKKSKPLHYISSDGFDIYVGKNNRQNDELTLRMAGPADIWMHTKEIPGSHVIVVTNGTEPPEATLNEAAHLAAYYSRGRASALVPVDYTQKRHVKKPNGAKPGMVIYETNKTAYVTPDEAVVRGLRSKD